MRQKNTFDKILDLMVDAAIILALAFMALVMGITLAQLTY